MIHIIPDPRLPRFHRFSLLFWGSCDIPSIKKFIDILQSFLFSFNGEYTILIYTEDT